MLRPLKKKDTGFNFLFLKIWSEFKNDQTMLYYINYILYSSQGTNVYSDNIYWECTAALFEMFLCVNNLTKYECIINFYNFFLSIGNWWKSSATTQKRCCNEVYGAEVGASSKVMLPHWKA